MKNNLNVNFSFVIFHFKNNLFSFWIFVGVVVVDAVKVAFYFVIILLLIFFFMKMVLKWPAICHCLSFRPVNVDGVELGKLHWKNILNRKTCMIRELTQ
jgi:uncharacterized membrane protein YcaP (DUF421 family)